MKKGRQNNENGANNVSTATEKKVKHISIKSICYCAVLVALGVIANTYTVYLNAAGSNALSFAYTVDFIAGAFFGPFIGFLTGALGDLLGWVINPSGGAFNPFLTVTSGLLGLIPGVVFAVYKKFFAKKKRYIAFFPLVTVLSFVLVWIVCTNLNTVIMYFYYIVGKSKKYTSFGLYYAFRIPWQTLFWAINAAVCAVLVVPMKKLLKL